MHQRANRKKHLLKLMQRVIKTVFRMVLKKQELCPKTQQNPKTAMDTKIMVITNYGYNYGYGYGQAQKGTLDYAIQSGDLKSVKELVEKKNADVNSANQSGYSPLQMASRFGFVEIVKYLIKKGASVNYVSNDNYTPLKEALTYKKTAVAEVLLNNGADAKYIDNAGYSMLYWAAQSGNKKLVEMMIKKGASPDSVASNGYGPMLVSVSMGHYDVAKYLLENGGNPDEADTYSGFSCLMYAVRNNRQNLVDLIAAKTRNINFY